MNMFQNLRSHWKVVLTVFLGLAVLGTLAWAWNAKTDFAQHKSRGTGLTTLSPEDVAKARQAAIDSANVLPPNLLGSLGPLDSLVPPLAGMVSPLDSLLVPMGGMADDIQIQTEDDRLVIELSVPNLNEASLQIQADRQSLHVSGQQETVQEEKDASGQVVSSSRSSSSYSTSFSLPEPVEPDGLKSHYENGRLRIEIPRLYKET
jgi:HSP20 family molecular chaperone IbpA